MINFQQKMLLIRGSDFEVLILKKKIDLYENEDTMKGLVDASLICP